MVNKDLYMPENDFYDLVKYPLPSKMEFEDIVEFTLLFMDLKSKPAHYSDLGLCRYNLNTFDGFILLDPKVILNKDIIFLNPEAEGIDLSLHNNSLNMKWLYISENSGIVMLQKYRQLLLKELRGKNFHNGRIIEERNALLTKNDTWYTFEETYLSHKIGHKEFIVPACLKKDYVYDIKEVKKRIKSDTHEEFQKKFWMSISMQLTFYYEWFAYIRENEKSIGFKIPINPESFEDIFKMAEFGNTASGRKKAIIHWVKSHLRNIKEKQNCNDNYRQVLVKKHLRGETKFNWNGLECHIIPAQYDLIKSQSKKKFITV